MVCVIMQTSAKRPNSLILGLFQLKSVFNYLIPGTSPTQPKVKLTAGPMCIEMDGLFQNKNQVSPLNV